MPQLMPLNWYFSFFMVVFMLLVMMMIYFDILLMNSNKIFYNVKYKVNWKW